MKKSTLNNLAKAAIVAALYAALTCLWPLSIGLVQLRISEALCLLPYCMGAAVPGLFVGCLLGNLLCGALPLDVLLGSLATLLAAGCTYLLGKKKAPTLLIPLPTVLFNALIIGALLCFVYDYGLSYPIACLQVGGGEAICCCLLGQPLLLWLKKHPKLLG